MSISAGHPVEVAAVEQIVLPGSGDELLATAYRPDTTPNGPALIFMHGGGWVSGSRITHDPICRALARMSGVQLVSLEYRLAPEHPFPAAVDDCWDATQFLIEHASEFALDPNRIGVGGDSAGGNLAAVIARRARDSGLPLACQYLVYPVLSAGRDTESYQQFAAGYGLTHEDMEWFWSLYLAGTGQHDHPEVSPLAATDLAGLAPATIISAECDVLRDQDELYALRLAQAGVPTTLWRAPQMVHGFLRYLGVSQAVKVQYAVLARMLATALFVPAERGE
jgi:acetyl esterase